MAVMTEDGLRVSNYAIGQWVKYGEDQATGRICGIRWDDAEPVMSSLFNHWTGEWYHPGFMYKIYEVGTRDDFDGSEEIPEDDITIRLGDAQAADYEKIRDYRLEQQLLVNVVMRCLKENNGQLPEFYFANTTPLPISWDEPPYKVGMHVRWHSKAGCLFKNAVSGTGIILGVERCITEEPGFWTFRLHYLTGHKFPANSLFSEQEITEVLQPLEKTELMKAMNWG
jgi:hypothetical protein